MKWHLYLILALAMIPIVYSIEDCKAVMDKGGLPCLVISSWEFPCAGESIKIYDSTPTLIRTAPLADYGSTSKCNITFGIAENETTIGSYLLNWTTRDSSKIVVEEDEDMILGIVLGVGIISSLLLFFAFKLDDEHTILKILFMISSITLLILIPVSTFITTTANAGKTFYRVFLYIFIAFWLYVFLYFCYWILKKLGWIVSGEEND